MEQAIDKTMVTRAIISKIQDERKPKKIKTNHVIGYDSPNKISIKGRNKEYVPDIAAVFDNSISVYEIELNKTMPFEKWRLLSLYARENNGNLFLVVPDFLTEPIKEKIKEKEINAGIIYFKTE
ncbi:MAG: hypothetical protein R6W78_12965 [Bacteroidales bacterium]